MNPGASQHILMIGINYWPEETGNAPYTTGLAEHLAKRGDRVTMLTGMPYYPQWRVTPEFHKRLRARSRISGVDVRRFATYVPSRQTAMRRIGFEGGFFANALFPGHLEKPDVIIGVVPSLGGAVLARLLARRHGVAYGLIFQDLVGGAAKQSGMPGGGAVAGATSKIEGWAARGADEVAIVSEGFRGYLADLGVEPTRVTRLRNWSHISPPVGERAAVRAAMGWPHGQTIALHAGAMGLKQGLANIVETARLAVENNPDLRFVFMGDGNQRAMLAHLASGLSNVEFRDPAPKADFPDILAAADVLLVNERASVVDMSLPSKMTSYFVAGRPIVAAVSEGATAMEVRLSGAGIVVSAERPAELLAAIVDLSRHPGRAHDLAAAGQRYARVHLDKHSILAEAERFVARLANPAAIRPSLTISEELA